MLKAGKNVIIMRNDRGEKAFGVWKRRKVFAVTNVNGAIIEWVYDVLGDEYKGQELTGAKVLKVLDSIKEKISEIVLATNILKVNITFDEIPQGVIERMNKEQTVIRQKTIKKFKQKIRAVGPETVFAPTIVDKAEGAYYLHSLEPDKDGNLRIIRKRHIREAEAGIGSAIDGKTEYIVTPKSLTPRGRGRGFLFETIGSETVNTKNSLKSKSNRKKNAKAKSFLVCKAKKQKGFLDR